MSNVVVGETLAPITEPPSVTTTALPINEESDDAVIIIRTTTLMILLVMSLVGNALVVLSVAQARSTRFVPFNAFVLSMASYCLLECAVTMSLATGFSIEKQWNFGEFLAGFNASFIQLQNVGILLTIAVMSIDRYFAVTNVTKYHAQSSVHRANYVVLFTWIHAFIFSLPLLFQNQSLGITCRAFVERCLCGLVEGTSLVFTSLLVALCFAIPSCVVIVFIILVRTKALKEKRRLESINSTEYSTYYLQESLILKEAEWSKYVTMLFLLFLFFKSPYIIVDIMTQLNFPLVFESTVSDGSRFYYQTAIAWMMFCYSALFPVLTFIQFPDHWRKMKSYATCTPTTTSAANGGPLTRSQRQLRQKQRRLRQRQKIAKQNARNRKRASVGNASNVASSDKATSIVSPSITSEKIAVNGSSTGGVLFRVPVLYPAVDGLHLVASEKVLPTASNDDAKKNKTGTASNNKHEESSSKKLPISLTSKITQPSSDVIDFRPCSVVDKRVDVTGSRDGLHIDDDIAYINSAYFNSDFDQDETDSELNESGNSHTLIWPHKRPRVAASASSVKVKDRHTKSVWDDSQFEGRWSYEELRSAPSHSVDIHVETPEDRTIEDPPHPHTPSPPPDEYALRSSMASPADDHVTKTIHFSKLKLPAIKSQNTSVTSANSSLSREEKPWTPSEAPSYNDPAKFGYESLNHRRSDSEVSVGVAPNHLVNQSKAFVSEDPSTRDADGAVARDNSIKMQSVGLPEHDAAHSSQTRQSVSTHRLIKVASRNESLSVAQHIGRYRHPSPLPDLIPDQR